MGAKGTRKVKQEGWEARSEQGTVCIPHAVCPLEGAFLLFGGGKSFWRCYQGRDGV